jgi:acyl-CoA hydrolase
MNQADDLMMPRPVRDSQSEVAEIVLPNDTNPLGALLGGRLMHWIDVAGAIATPATTWSRLPSITWTFGSRYTWATWSSCALP